MLYLGYSTDSSQEVLYEGYGTDSLQEVLYEGYGTDSLQPICRYKCIKAYGLKHVQI